MGGKDKDTWEGWNKKVGKETWEKIVGSRYIRWYKMVRDRGEPKSLWKMEKRSGWSRIKRMKGKVGRNWGEGDNDILYIYNINCINGI